VYNSRELDHHAHKPRCVLQEEMDANFIIVLVGLRYLDIISG